MLRDIGGCLLLFAAVSLRAHHAPALYDNDRLLRIESEVVELHYRFPHSEMRVRMADGTEWTVSLAPPDVSERQGAKAGLLAIQQGDRVTVFGWPHKIKDNEIRSHKLVFADGRVIEGAFNSLYEPKEQKALKKLLSDPAGLRQTDLGATRFGTSAEALRLWMNDQDPLTRLAIDIDARRAFFIGTTGEGKATFPGIRHHLACLATTHPVRLVDPLQGPALEYVEKRNEWFARYLEGQLNICE